MREGYWINYKTVKIFPITEHEIWIRDLTNAKKLGVPKEVSIIAENIKNREKYLMFLMSHAPIMRVRGHGSDVTFEFSSRDRQMVMDVIWIWGRQNAGPLTFFNIINFATKEETYMNYEEFESQMDKGGAKAVLRVAGSTGKMVVSSKVIRELLQISKLLISTKDVL